MSSDWQQSVELRARIASVIPPSVRAVCHMLASAGHQAVIVGGAVRDAILDRTPEDWDVATSALPEQVMGLFRHTIPTGLQHGTITVVTGHDSVVEVTTFRGEGAYSDGRRPDHVTLGVPLFTDLSRRDLRVNAMAYDPASGTLFDPFNGLTDIAERRLRAVGPTGRVYDEAVARFTEDGLRIMRAVRFAAALKFTLDPETERGITQALPALSRVSKERISDELRKILATPHPSAALLIAERTQLIALILPELSQAFDAWAAKLRVGRSSAVARWLARVDAVSPIARLGALVAELADPDLALRRLDRRTQRTAEAVLRRLKFSNEEVTVAAVLVGVAAAPLAPGWTDREVRRLLADIARSYAPAVVALWRADHAMDLADRAEAILARRDPLSVAELAVTGKDLLVALDMLPGPGVGRLLAALLDRVLIDPALNRQDPLIEIARELMRQPEKMAIPQ